MVLENKQNPKRNYFINDKQNQIKNEVVVDEQNLINNESVIGAVMILGSGISGIQASLDLADSGYKVYLIEKGPSIGGKMMQLDKTFPTNDCATCIAAPKLVECIRHRNIEVMTLCEVLEVNGHIGNFRITVKRNPRYVDLDKCTGCGQCIKACPVKLPNEFDLGLSQRKAIYRYSPQADPNAPVIDAPNCRYLTMEKCRACEKICPTGAINFEDKEELINLNVGAIILAVGFEQLDASNFKEFGYGRYPNVITALQFERIMNSSGPFLGHIQRLSDGKKPEKIAFIQCVGSRTKERNYCSSVCCMQATKESIMIKEHIPEIDVTLFYMDIRAYGKEFEQYYKRAKDKYKIRYIRSMPSSIEEDPISHNLYITYIQDGSLKTDEFDVVILSIGVQPSLDAKKLSEIMGINLNEYGFCKTDRYLPVKTSKKGVFVCGPFSEPKDIAESVTQGCAAAGLAGSLLSQKRGTLVKEKIFPEELDVSEQEPKIGVFICHCGNNIAGVVDINSVRDYAEKLPDVVYCEDMKYACTQDSLKKITQTIKENSLNRIVVASCSPRTHEALFMESLKKAGLNQFLCEMANIRNQCSWVHSDQPKKATEKSKDLIRMSVARAANLEPLHLFSIPINKNTIILGAGIAGMTAALTLSKQGFEVTLVEKQNEPGGLAKRIEYDLEDKQPKKFAEELIYKIEKDPKINLLTNSELTHISGFVGNFISTIEQKIENGKSKKFDIKHGVLIVATGGEEYQGTDYGYGKNDNIISQLELEHKLVEKEIDPTKLKKVVMIQCVGSRTEERPYCSRVCCGEAIKNALKLKGMNPDIEIIILYKDIMTYGFLEKYYTKARELGIVFLRYDDDNKPEVFFADNENKKNGKIKVKTIDLNLNKKFLIDCDTLVLSRGIIPSPSNEKLFQTLRVSLTEQGFYEEAHPKLRPVDFASEGFFLCGLAHTPRYIGEVVSQAQAAASRAAVILSQKELLTGGEVAVVDKDKCIGCLSCVRICPYQVPFINDDGVAQIEIANCYGCGICVGFCPIHAISLKNYKDEQVIPKIEALFKKEFV